VRSRCRALPRERRGSPRDPAFGRHSDRCDGATPLHAQPTRHQGPPTYRADCPGPNEVDGLPVTAVPRTLLDLATILTEPQLERACEQAVLEGVFDLIAISDLLRRSHGHRGVRRLRCVLAHGDLGSDVPASGLEHRFRELCEGAGLPPPEINRDLLLGDSYHKVDFLWRSQRVVIEVDSDRYHSTGWQRLRDAERDSLLRAHGYRAARVTEEEIEYRPAEATTTAAALLARRRR
jgi:hypothetical protein